jgi:hypothetical protein
MDKQFSFRKVISTF